MGTTPQGISNISTQCPNIGPLTAPHLKADIRKIDIMNDKPIDGNPSRRFLYKCSLASELVKGHPLMF
jgi:hypothetical protein